MGNIETDPFGPYRELSTNAEVSYSAGFPSYPRNFSRDVLVAGLISSRPDLLTSQLKIAAANQGESHNPQTGEMPGKIHHELPGVKLNDGNRYTTYNACDTSALFLIAAEALLKLDKVELSNFLKDRAASLEKAVEYIFAQLGVDNLFYDRPPEGSSGYALKVTYWKDSILPHADGKTEPVYPVVFHQAHFIAARGLLSASRLLHDAEIANVSDKMFQAGISGSMQSDSYTIYRDSLDELHQASSDELHSLAYIPKDYADLLPVEAIRERAAEFLATPFGYICTPVEVARYLSDRYHGDKVWIFEQAMIHYGATKFGLRQERHTAALVANHIEAGQELLGVQPGGTEGSTPVPEGNSRQLWSVAAKEYFAGRSLLSENSWL